MFFPDCGGVAAKRQERRPGGGVRRTGQPDGIWAAGRGVGAVEGNDVVGSYLHADFDYAIGLCVAADRADVGVLECEAGTDNVAASAIDASGGACESSSGTEIG